MNAFRAFALTTLLASFLSACGGSNNSLPEPDVLGNVPVDPAPVAPISDDPAPVAPVSDDPAPVAPVSDVPAPVTPVSDVPAPVAPVSDVPAPVTPVSDVPAQDAPEPDAPASEQDIDQLVALAPKGPLDTSKWALEASSGADAVSAAIDGDPSTRWTTREVQRPGQWLEIDLGETSVFDSIELSSLASPGDYPRGYELFASNSRADWGEPVAAADNSDGGAVLTARFAPVNARYLRIVQTGSAERLWWSIHEITVSLEDDAAVAAPVDPAPPALPVVPVPVAPVAPPVAAPAPPVVVAPAPPVVDPVPPVVAPAPPVIVPAPPAAPAAPDPELVALYEFGAEVYAAKCANCHMPLDISTKRIRTRGDIERSLVNIRAMRNVVLNSEELDALTYVLNNVHPRDALNQADEEVTGEKIFEQQCASCHADDADPMFPLLVRQTELESIANYTALSMPPTNPAACGEECAAKVAEYILSDASGIESNEGALEKADVGTQRLVRDHYYATLEQLIEPFGLNVDDLSHPEDPVVDGFSAGSQVDATLIFTYHTNAGVVARGIVEAAEDNNRLIGCNTNGLRNNCIRNFYLGFAEQAYRRPLLDSQIDRLNSIYAASNGNMLVGLGNTLGFVLQSPSFLYHLDPVDDGSDYALASQLSYLLWNEPPDEELLDLAANNALRNPSELEKQVDRLLADSKSETALLDFVSQWLDMKGAQRIVKDTGAVPGFSDDAVADMNRDLLNFVTRSLGEEKSFEFLFNGGYELSNRLASTLGQWSNNVKANRRGVLSQPGILASLAGPVERSPILRGAYVMDRLLCDHRPPIADIDEFVQELVIPEDASPRERTVALTASPVCQACHASINTLGFGFEDFDGLGLPIAESLSESFVVPATNRASGTTLSYNGVEGLQRAMLQTNQFYDCAVDKAIGYANLISRPRGASAESIYTDFRTSADLKTLFKAIALTVLDNNQ